MLEPFFLLALIVFLNRIPDQPPWYDMILEIDCRYIIDR
jgi:hypothetical protein